ncbi:hypothetical protein BASA50_006533 [Batrachochytrium salamandrivorans]|uniref:GDP/GTP exchange factor Sec2 N-terminal domain-containing protein n=1 Tax=Batrachochytrium salamandrivorans TaxID=1357716 RepID=A0ABQ8F9Q2_9FUNG|nr:hypothetical protein BASA50_006533 [Batrachochytrium salamandrivorans]
MMIESDAVQQQPSLFRRDSVLSLSTDAVVSGQQAMPGTVTPRDADSDRPRTASASKVGRMHNKEQQDEALAAMLQRTLTPAKLSTFEQAFAQSRFTPTRIGQPAARIATGPSAATVRKAAASTSSPVSAFNRVDGPVNQLRGPGSSSKKPHQIQLLPQHDSNPFDVASKNTTSTAVNATSALQEKVAKQAEALLSMEKALDAALMKNKELESEIRRLTIAATIKSQHTSVEINSEELSTVSARIDSLCDSQLSAHCLVDALSVLTMRDQEHIPRISDSQLDTPSVYVPPSSSLTPSKIPLAR